MRSRTTFGVVCCATAMTILGASVAVSREILELPVFYAQAARYAVAAAILGAIATATAARSRRRTWPSRRGPAGAS